MTTVTPTTAAPTLLRLDASLFSGHGNSSHLTQAFVDAWRARHPDGRVIERDLAADPVPHLDAARIGAFMAPVEKRTPEQAAVVAASDALIDEIKAADTLVLGLPMYNFGLPSQLKAWIDHITRAGVTFRYGANGPEGLVGNRKLYVLAASGGVYRGTPAETATAYITTLFNFIGITDIEFVYAEGLKMGDEVKARSLQAAQASIEKLAA